jgi:hypothetical protein
MKRTKKGHGVGKESVSISTSIPVSVDAELRKLATASELTRGGYAREAIEQAVKAGYIREVTRTTIRDRKVVKYPLDNPQNPTARAADNAGL